MRNVNQRNFGRLNRFAIFGMILVFGAMMAGFAEAQNLQYVPGRILVKARAGVSPEKFQGIIKANNGRVKEVISQIGVHIVELPEQANEMAVMHAFSKRKEVEFAELDMLVELSAIPNDPRYADQWHLPKINAPIAWDFTTGSGVVVAVLDTGVNANHEDLVGQVLSGWNTVSNSTDSSDIFGHGTSVAGTIAASINNGIGIASVSGLSKILPIRVTDNASTGVAYSSDIAEAITWAADHGADVVNISYRISGYSTVKSAANYFKNKGGLTVSSAGNDGSDPGFAPTDDIISVSATNSSDVKASWSNFGNWIDVTAPGVGILSTKRGGGYGNVSGTSFSSPITAAVVALIKSANPTLSPAEVELILESTVDDLGAAGFDTYYGHGRVNAGAAVAAALEGAPIDNDPPTILIVSPINQVLSGSVNVNVDAQDNVGVNEVHFFINGQFHSKDISYPYTFNVDTMQYSNGSIEFMSKAYDHAGLEGISDAVSNTIDNHPDFDDPIVTISQPVDGATVSGRVTIDVQSSDNVGVTQLSLYINDVLKSSTTASSLRSQWNTKKEPAGVYTLRAVAKDAFGNEGIQSISVTVASSSSGGSKGGGGGKGRKK